MSAPHCSGCHTDSTGIVLCCPLHAQADTAIDLLRRLVREWDAGLNTDGAFIALQEAVSRARPLLAAIDGAHAHAESEA